MGIVRNLTRQEGGTEHRFLITASNRSLMPRLLEQLKSSEALSSEALFAFVYTGICCRLIRIGYYS